MNKNEQCGYYMSVPSCPLSQFDHTFLPEAIMLSLQFWEMSLCLAFTDAGLKCSSSKLRLTFPCIRQFLSNQALMHVSHRWQKHTSTVARLFSIIMGRLHLSFHAAINCIYQTWLIEMRTYVCLSDLFCDIRVVVTGEAGFHRRTADLTASLCSQTCESFP